MVGQLVADMLMQFLIERARRLPHGIGYMQLILCGAGYLEFKYPHCLMQRCLSRGKVSSPSGASKMVMSPYATLLETPMRLICWSRPAVRARADEASADCDRGAPGRT